MHSPSPLARANCYFFIYSKERQTRIIPVHARKYDSLGAPCAPQAMKNKRVKGTIKAISFQGLGREGDKPTTEYFCFANSFKNSFAHFLWVRCAKKAFDSYNVHDFRFGFPGNFM